MTAEPGGTSFRFGDFDGDEDTLRLVSDRRARSSQRLARRCDGCGLPLSSFPSRASFADHTALCIVNARIDTDDSHHLDVVEWPTTTRPSTPWKRKRITR